MPFWVVSTRHHSEERKMLTQQEVVKLLTQEGYRISVRTLRYWASKGIIPRPILISNGRYGLRGYYPESILAEIRPLCKKEGRRKDGVIEIIDWPGAKRLEVVEIIERKAVNGKIYVWKKLKDGGVIFQVGRRKD